RQRARVLRCKVLDAVAAACSVLRGKVLGGSLHGAGAPPASARSTWQREFKHVTASVPSTATASVPSTLPRQFQARYRVSSKPRCRVSSKHAAAAAQSTLRRSREAPWGVSSRSTLGRQSEAR